jgi:hypothetical protein
MQQVSPKIDVAVLRLVINLLRRAELDYLAPHISKRIRASAVSTLFGVGESLLPKVCSLLSINLTAARLLLLLWKSQGKVGDPLFGFLDDPESLERLRSGQPMVPPGFDLLRIENARDNQSKSRCRKTGPRKNRPNTGGIGRGSNKGRKRVHVPSVPVDGSEERGILDNPRI